jgi:hypothetical protein
LAWVQVTVQLPSHVTAQSVACTQLTLLPAPTST